MRQLVSKDDATMSVRTQCKLLEVNRSGIYYKPVGVSVENLDIMRLIDRHNTYHPERLMLRAQILEKRVQSSLLELPKADKII